MKITETDRPGVIMIDCQACGKMFDVLDFRGDDQLSEISKRHYEQSRHCPACEARLEQERKQAEARRDLEEFRALLPIRVHDAGIPPAYITDRQTGRILQSPPCPQVTQFLQVHQGRNIMLSGLTGTGKSTSACLQAVRMIADRKDVIYTTLRHLNAHWRAAKTGEEYATESMLRRLFSHDLVIIDEFAGKTCTTESTQEMLFEILESINNGMCRSKFWLLGNFYTGSLREIFGEDDPARRRLQENFVCATVGAKGVEVVKVWEARRA